MQDEHQPWASPSMHCAGCRIHSRQINTFTTIWPNCNDLEKLNIWRANEHKVKKVFKSFMCVVRRKPMSHRVVSPWPRYVGLSSVTNNELRQVIFISWFINSSNEICNKFHFFKAKIAQNSGFIFSSVRIFWVFFWQNKKFRYQLWDIMIVLFFLFYDSTKTKQLIVKCLTLTQKLLMSWLAFIFHNQTLHFNNAVSKR